MTFRYVAFVARYILFFSFFFSFFVCTVPSRGVPWKKHAVCFLPSRWNRFIRAIRPGIDARAPALPFSNEYPLNPTNCLRYDEVATWIINYPSFFVSPAGYSRLLSNRILCLAKNGGLVSLMKLLRRTNLMYSQSERGRNSIEGLFWCIIGRTNWEIDFLTDRCRTDDCAAR